jgi:hypothetical protein
MNNQISIKPFIEQLTPNAIEMLKNMNDLETAKKYIDSLAVDAFSGDQTEIIFFMAFLEAIKEKADDPKKTDHPVDFITYLQDRMFLHTVVFEQSAEVFCESLKTGNFAVGKIAYPKHKKPPEEPDSAEIKQPDDSTSKVSKAVAELLNNPETPVELFNLLADYVGDLQTEISGDGWRQSEHIGKLLAFKKTKAS